MSNYIFRAKNKTTGERVDVHAMDDFFGKHKYGYRIGNKNLTEEEFYKEYEDMGDY